MVKRIALLLVTVASLAFAPNPSHAQSLMSPCMRAFASRRLDSIRKIALAKNQRALKPSPAPSFVQAQTKS